LGAALAAMHRWGRYGTYAYGNDGYAYRCYYTRKYSYRRHTYGHGLVCH
jgi:hypothetical protein